LHAKAKLARLRFPSALAASMAAPRWGWVPHLSGDLGQKRAPHQTLPPASWFGVCLPK
jgi:hypothetical protein